ncbi:uncharacterized protein LOC115228125 [Octopus sinensis]|uniref:Uncharacterized protein LOC115228125 n=1 Tax=Octopus sinensis TaxID=2607531 RepID=A0A6P7TXJ4_9MOLL|nr:uncharacterized protein LOC115228125 [Octopus sinensis]
MTERTRYRKYSDDTRKIIIETHESFGDWKSLCSSLGVHWRTAYQWILNKDNERRPKGGKRHSKKSQIIVNELISWIEADPQITLKECAEKIQNNHSISVSVTTVKNWLDGELISLNTCRPIVANVNSLENKEKRIHYLDCLSKAKSTGRTLIWIDESNYNLYCTRKEGRSKIGSRSLVLTPNSRVTNLYCISAMSASTLLNFQCKRGSYREEDYKEWMKELINECRYLSVQNPTFITDNAHVHNQLESVVEQEENIELLRLPPYSYLLNPIELAWSIFKAEVKKMLREKMPIILKYNKTSDGPSISEYRLKILEEIVGEAKKVLTPEKLMGFVNQVEEYYPRVTRGEDLFDC